MRWLPSKRWGLLAPSAVIGLGLLAGLWDIVPVQVLRNALFDQYQRWQPRQYIAAPVRIIDIDDESLKRFGQWPWPRTRIAELTARLQDAQAAVIAFDIVFAEPDRTSPKAMLEVWHAPAPMREQISRLADHDEVLADVFARGKVVLGLALDQQARADAQPLPAGLQASRYVTVGEFPRAYTHGFTGAVTALPALQAVAEGNGALNFVPDTDGVVRRVPLVLRVGSTLVPTLAAEALRVAQGAKNYIIHSGASLSAGLDDVRVGQLTVPTTPFGEVWVHFTKPVAERYLPAWKVLDGGVPPEQLRGRIVLVGVSAQGLTDLRFSPMGAALPGVEIHAQLIEQALTGGGLTRPAWASVTEALAMVAGGVGVSLVALNCAAALSFGVLGVLLAALWAVGWWAFSASGLLLDPVLPSLVVLACFVFASIVHHLGIERRQAWVKQAFASYVSPNLVAHLMANPQALELSGKRQECSFVFTDLAGFTSLMEQMDPAKAVTLLNVYLEQMIAIAFAHDGTLDRIVGDAVAIMFSAPVTQLDHPQRALACALEMQRFAAQHLNGLAQRDIAFCHTRIGVHTGEVIVGNFGGPSHFDYRALGDPVNTAARLEAANKQLGTLICVSQATLAGCPQALARPVGRLLLPGKQLPLMVFEPIDASTGAQADLPYQQAYEWMRDGDGRAQPAFERLSSLRPSDALVRLHVDRLRTGGAGDLILLAGK
jgi:adenylate cyclase